jgi:hypothetical protein
MDSLHQLDCIWPGLKQAEGNIRESDTFAFKANDEATFGAVNRTPFHTKMIFDHCFQTRIV